MADCKNSKVFLEELTRMCNSHGRCADYPEDTSCPLWLAKGLSMCRSCFEVMQKYPSYAVDVVHDWSNKNPKTIPIKEVFEHMFTVD